MFTNQDLKRLILPLIVEQILAVSVGMVDTMMVSNAGEAATSGVSLVDMVNTLFINIFCGGGNRRRGGVLPVSGTEEKGQGLPVSQPADFDNCMYFTYYNGALHPVSPGVLHLLYGGVAGDVMANALVYLTISALSYPFLAVYNSCAALFRSMGNSKISMQASIIMNIINVIGDSPVHLCIPLGCGGCCCGFPDFTYDCLFYPSLPAEK